MKILVTGAAGFIGFHLAKKLSDEGYEVVGLDSINEYYDKKLKLDRLKVLGISTEPEYGSKIRSSIYTNLSFIKLNLVNKKAYLIYLKMKNLKQFATSLPKQVLDIH